MPKPPIVEVEHTMTLNLSAVVWNTLIASALTVLVGLLGRTVWLRRRPAVMHTMWLLVLAKFVTPAFIPVPLLPAQRASLASGRVEPTEVTAHGARPAETPAKRAAMPNGAISALPAPSPPAQIGNSSPVGLRSSAESPGSPRSSWVAWFAGVSLCGSAWIVLSGAIRMVRFHRWLRASSAVNERLSGLMESCRGTMTVRDAPAVRALQATYSPFLWAGPRRPCIYVPQAMIGRFSDEQLAALLCHELAHHVRRDHWANLFAFGVAALCWWNPLVWWVRQALREVQELCCDAMVLGQQSLSRRAYAETLLTSLDVVGNALRVPSALASGWGDATSLQARFQMIGDSTVVPRVSFAYALAASLLAGTLLCIPVRAQSDAKPTPRSASPAAARAEVSAQVPATAPAPQPTPKAAARAAELKATITSFSLQLTYRGAQDKPYYGLRLSVEPLVQDKPYELAVTITRQQAEKVVDYLATEGYLDRALDSNRDRSPSPPPEPYYSLIVQAKGKTDVIEWFAWDLNMLKRLDGLRNVLDGEAAKKMDLLIGRLSGHRREWEGQDGARLPARVNEQVQQVPVRPTFGVERIHPSMRESKLWLELKDRLAKSGVTYRWVEVGEKGVCRLSLEATPTADISGLNGLKLAYLDLSNTVVNDLSPLVGMPLRQLNLSGSQVQSLAPLKGIKLAILDISATQVTDLTPLAEAELTHLVVIGRPIADLLPLAQMPLTYLDLRRAGVQDLSPLAKTPLATLQLEETRVTDLRPLRKVPIKTLTLSWFEGLDLSQLQGTSLKSLTLTGQQIADLAPLRGLKLERLAVENTGVRDLAPLAGMPLVDLELLGTPVMDLAPLKGMRLVHFSLPAGATDLAPLSGMPLKTISVPNVSGIKQIHVLRSIKTLEWIRPPDCKPLAATEFWRQYDAGEKLKPDAAN